MALPGETVSTGAPLPFPEATLEVCVSGAGYFIGYMDEDGSTYSRESIEYYEAYEDAAFALELDIWTRR